MAYIVKLLAWHIQAGSSIEPRAMVTLAFGEKHDTEHATGVGCVGALLNAVDDLLDRNIPDWHADLELYRVTNERRGKNSKADATVRLAHNGTSAECVGEDPDTLKASIEGYIAAVNKLARRLDSKQHQKAWDAWDPDDPNANLHDNRPY